MPRLTGARLVLKGREDRPYGGAKLSYGARPSLVSYEVHYKTTPQVRPRQIDSALALALLPAITMDVSQFYADSPPTVVPLSIKQHFEALTEKQKLYAHYISRSVSLPYSHCKSRYNLISSSLGYLRTVACSLRWCLPCGLRRRNFILSMLLEVVVFT